MRRIYLWFTVIFVFSAAFTAGIITASGQEDKGGQGSDPWFAVKQSNTVTPAISAVVTYGDTDRGCRCFPLTDDQINGSTCIESASGDSLAASGTNCNALACRRAGNATVAANYCTDHNGHCINADYNPASNTSACTIRFPGSNHADAGEFNGMFDYAEQQIQNLFSQRYDLLFPVLQTLLCGETICMHITNPFSSDMCVVLADGNSTNNTCYGATPDQIMLYANRAFVKIFPYYDPNATLNGAVVPATKIRAVIGLYLVNQDYTTGAQKIQWPPGSGNYPVSFPTSTHTGNYTGPSGQAGSSEVCMEAYLRGGITGAVRIYTDALILRIDLQTLVVQNPITKENSIFDVCATDAQMDFKGLVGVGDVGTGINSDLEYGEDGSNVIADVETIGTLHSLVRDIVNKVLHGSCPGMVNYCNMINANLNYYTTSFGSGGGCPGQVEACRRVSGFTHDCNSIGSSCAILGASTMCNISAFYDTHVVSTGIPPIDKWLTYTAGNNPSKNAGEGGCTYGIFPIDLNNVLSRYQPFSLNMPGYDPVNSKYGTLEVGGNTFDIGAYIENTIRQEPNNTPGTSNRMRIDLDMAVRPRWADYWGCIDTQEMGTIQYTKPPLVAASGGPAAGAFKEPGYMTDNATVCPAGTAPNCPQSYMAGLAISQDFFAEVMNVLYASNFFCWDINHNNISSMLNFAQSSTGVASGSGIGLSTVGELLRVPAFAMFAPGVETIADPDAYASVKLVPAGAPSARVGQGTYTYPVEYLEDIMPELSTPVSGGLKGECYNDSAGLGKFEKFVGVLGEYPNAVTVWYNWRTGAPTCNPASPGVDTFSILWTGYVMAPFDATYTFCTRTDDGVRLMVNNQTLVNSWIDQGAAAFPGQCGSIALTQGLHPIRMEYYENGGGAEAHLYWCVPAASTPNAQGIQACNVANESYVIPAAYLYTGGTPANQASGTFDVYIKLPASRFEVWAPLNDGIPNQVSNEPVRLFSLEAFLSIGLDIEFIRNQVKTVQYWGWDQNSGTIGSSKVGAFADFFRIFVEIHPQLVDIKYAADQRLTRSQMQDAIASIFTSVASAYLQATVDTKLDVTAILGAFSNETKYGSTTQDIGLLFRSFAPGGPAASALNESQPPLWSASSAPSYLTTYLWVGKDTVINWNILAPILPVVTGMISLGPHSPVTTGPFLPVLQYLTGGDGKKAEGEPSVQTYIHAPAGVFFEDEPDPAWTRGYALTPAQSLAGGLGQSGTKIGFVGYDLRGTALTEMRYSTRFDGGFWGVPRYSQKLEIPTLLEGKHTLEVMAIAPDGTADSEPARLDFVVDTQAPALKLQNVSEATFITDENPVFSVEASDFQSQPENIRIAYRLDDGEIVDNGFSKIVRLSHVAPPDHRIQILAQDEAGNVGGIVEKFMVKPERGGFGCGTFSSNGVNRIGTIVVIILFISFPIMLILFLKVYYREKAEQKVKGQR